MKFFTFIIFAFFGLSALAQTKGLDFEKRLHDFGGVHNWNNPGAVFLFTNKSSSDLLFLPTFPRDDVFVKLPKGRIAAGKSDTVVVYYFTGTPGEFQKSVDLNTNLSDQPVKLSVKGNIISLDANAYVSCPGFAPKAERIDELAIALKDTIQRAQPQPNQPARSAETTAEEVMLFEEFDNEAPVVTAKETAPVTESTLLPESRYSPNNIVFLIDISSSMKKADKLPLLKISMKNLAQALRKIDYVSVIVYSSTSAVALPATTADNKQKITGLIDSLSAGGFTNGIKGLETAYEIAEQNFISGGNNQVIIATDGLFNSPNYSERDLVNMVSAKASENVILSVVGFGNDRSALKLMKKISEKGNGSFIQIADQHAANEILIEEVKLHSAR